MTVDYSYQSSRLRLITSLRTWIIRDGVVLLLFAVVALAAMYPVVTAPRSRIIGWLGDNVQYVYITGWMAQAVLLGQSPFVDPRLNYPDDLALMATDIPYLSILSVAPVTWVFGAVFSYNLIIWLSMGLSGYFTYLWVRQITGSRTGAALAGLAFLLTPYRIAHAYGHLQLVATFALPLFFWALDSVLRSSTWRNLALLCGATFLVGSAAQYYLVMGLISGVFYTLFMMITRPVDLLRHGWQIAMSVGTGAVVSALPYLRNLNDDIYTPYDIQTTRIWSADPLNFVLPSKLHPIWGALVEQVRPEPLWIEKTLYIGMVAGLLALIALCWPTRRYLGRRSLWAGMALVGVIFALGTDLHINNEPIQASDPFWLPVYYLAHLPIVTFLRTWSRFGIILIFFVCLLAGLGATYLLQRLKRGQTIAVVVLFVLLLVDLLPGRVEVSTLTPRPVDQWLAQQPGDFAVAVLPAGNADVNYRAMYGSLLHAKHMTAFNHPNHLPAAYRAFAQQVADFPAPASLEAMRTLGITYVLLERRFFDGINAPDWESVVIQIEQASDASIVTELDGVAVIALE
jgi:hypothetical protein